MPFALPFSWLFGHKRWFAYRKLLNNVRKTSLPAQTPAAMCSPLFHVPCPDLNGGNLGRVNLTPVGSQSGNVGLVCKSHPWKLQFLLHPQQMPIC